MKLLKTDIVILLVAVFALPAELGSVFAATFSVDQVNRRYEGSAIHTTSGDQSINKHFTEQADRLGVLPETTAEIITGVVEVRGTGRRASASVEELPDDVYEINLNTATFASHFWKQGGFQTPSRGHATAIVSFAGTVDLALNPSALLFIAERTVNGNDNAGSFRVTDDAGEVLFTKENFDVPTRWAVPSAGSSLTVNVTIRSNSSRGSGRVGQRYEDANSQELTFSIREINPDLSGDGSIDVADIDLLTRCVLDGVNELSCDMNADRTVDQNDRRMLVKDIARTYFGDANLDGEFNSGDLVQVFEAAQYEDEIDMNSGWAEGDWNGDGDFTTTDLVAAFQDSGFEQGPRTAVALVPEPSSHLSLMLSMFLLAASTRHRAKLASVVC